MFLYALHPSPLALSCTMHPALLNADVGLHGIFAVCCIYCELTGQGLPLADGRPLMRPAEGSLPGKVLVPAWVWNRVSKGQTIFCPAILVTCVPPSPGPSVYNTSS